MAKQRLMYTGGPNKGKPVKVGDRHFVNGVPVVIIDLGQASADPENPAKLRIKTLRRIAPKPQERDLYVSRFQAEWK